MTYSIDFHKQGLRSIKDGMTIREADSFYGLSTSSIHSWQQSLAPKTTRKKAPTKISNEALLKDVKLQYFKQQGFPIIYMDESGFEI